MEALKNLPAHICALMGFFFLIRSTQEKKKNGILIYQSLFSFFFFLQYILIGAYSGSILCIVSLFRNILYYFKTNKISCFIVITLVLITGTITGIYDMKSYGYIIPFLPLIINILYAYILSKNNIKNIKKVFFICSIIWIIYNFFIGAYVGLICSILEMISYVFYFMRMKK